MPLKTSTPVGTDLTIPVNLRDRNDDPITALSAADTPYAEVSYGGGLGVLWSPPAEWNDASRGKYLIYLDKASTGGFDAGEYVISTGVVTASGQMIAAPDIGLTLTPTPSATAVVPPTDVTYRELLMYAPWLEGENGSIQNSAGFLSQRGQARRWLVEILLNWYAAICYRRRLSEGWYYDAPTVDAMQGYLNDGVSLQVGSRIKEIEARKTISLICQTTLTPSEEAGKNQYQQVAKEMMDMANVRVAGLRVRVVNGADNVDISFDDTVMKNMKECWVGNL